MDDFYYSGTDIALALERSEIEVTPRAFEPGASSIDLRTGKVYEIESTGEKGEEVPIPTTGLEVENGRRLIWESIEEVLLPPGLVGEVTIRSSWARILERVELTGDSFLRDPESEHKKKVECIFEPQGTDVLLLPGEPNVQLHVRSPEITPLTDEEVRDLLTRHPDDPECLGYSIGGRKVRPGKIDIDQGGLLITASSSVQVYSGGVLRVDPDNIYDPTTNLGCFSVWKLRRKGKEKRELGKGAVFKAIARELTEIPNHLVGKLDEILEGAKYSAHPLAPTAGPRSDYKNRLVCECLVREGFIPHHQMPLTRLRLYRVKTPAEPNGKTSGYQEQSVGRLRNPRGSSGS